MLRFHLMLRCTDPEAPNYDPEVTIDNGSCEVPDAQLLEPATLTQIPMWTTGLVISTVSSKRMFEPKCLQLRSCSRHF